MATKVHAVAKCRVTNSAVERGEPYYWWKFPMGEKQYSATYPTRAQLTQSDYLACVFELVDSIEDVEIDDPEDMEAMLEEFTEAITEVQEQCQANYDNMAYMLHQAPNGMLLAKRLEVMESVLEQLDSLDWDDCAVESEFNHGHVKDILQQLEITRRGKVIERY